MTVSTFSASLAQPPPQDCHLAASGGREDQHGCGNTTQRPPSLGLVDPAASLGTFPGAEALSSPLHFCSRLRRLNSGQIIPWGPSEQLGRGNHHKGTYKYVHVVEDGAREHMEGEGGRLENESFVGPETPCLGPLKAGDK